MGVYVQGKLVKLNNNQPLRMCGSKAVQLKDKEITVEIPGQSVESVKDFQPLSIFSAGSELDNCNPAPLPADLPEVRKALADKGSTRPYYSHAKEEISKIQSQVSNGCIQKYWTNNNPFNCVNLNGNYVCPSGYSNETLKNLNYVFESPGYGKIAPKNTPGNPESVPIASCYTYPNPNDDTRHFCLYYTIECPLCAAIRVH